MGENDTISIAVLVRIIVVRNWSVFLMMFFNLLMADVNSIEFYRVYTLDRVGRDYFCDECVSHQYMHFLCVIK